MSRFYLNNMTENELTINLSTNRVIKPLSSLPLNDEDVRIYETLKIARAGIPSMLDDLVFSTIPVEEDSRYKHAMSEVKEIEEKCKPCYAEGKTPDEKDCEACKAKEEQEKAAAEQKAKEELEAKAKEEQEKADEALKEKLRKEIIKQAKKEKRDFAEGELEKEVEEAFKKIKEQPQDIGTN